MKSNCAVQNGGSSPKRSASASRVSWRTVVRIAHDDDLAASLRPPPPLDPEVEHIVQIDIRQQGRCTAFAACRLTPCPRSVLQHADVEPLLNQSHAPVRYPVLEKFHQPATVACPPDCWGLLKNKLHTTPTRRNRVVPIGMQRMATHVNIVHHLVFHIEALLIGSRNSDYAALTTRAL